MPVLGRDLLLEEAHNGHELEKCLSIAVLQKATLNVLTILSADAKIFLQLLCNLVAADVEKFARYSLTHNVDKPQISTLVVALDHLLQCVSSFSNLGILVVLHSLLGLPERMDPDQVAHQ